MEFDLENMMKTAEPQLCHLSENQRQLYERFTMMAKEGKRPTFRESCQLKKLFKDLNRLNMKKSV